MSYWREELMQLTAAGIRPRYPWHLWLVPGESVSLVRGLDYHVETIRLQRTAGYAARARGIRGLRTQRTPEGVTLIVLRAEQQEQPQPERLEKCADRCELLEHRRRVHENNEAYWRALCKERGEASEP